MKARISLQSALIASLFGGFNLPGIVHADQVHLRAAWQSVQTPRWRPLQGDRQRSIRPDVRERFDVRTYGSLPRNAQPASRVRDLLVAQFRPDHRFDTPQEQPQVRPFNPATGDLHAQFRPLQPRRQLTYEQLQQQQRQPEPMLPPPMAMPLMPYPAAPFPPSPMPYWPPYW